ncbi:hypothetical protein JCM18920_1002 [Cutibacterium acnes JCM 18920]|nr:hypothetical protein JCM18920_1002 [Cutibacterium acnes JCM 18920]
MRLVPHGSSGFRLVFHECSLDSPWTWQAVTVGEFGAVYPRVGVSLLWGVGKGCRSIGSFGGQ